MLELARTLIGDRDVEPTLATLRELVQLTSYGPLVDRRRALS
ncbi:MAG TPA: hypothetical protein VNB64_05095 [Solirubrobacteraceae bacterium]|nr:hypothetical protein [Solirubrobacteraceae bacterium]